VKGALGFRPGGGAANLFGAAPVDAALRDPLPGRHRGLEEANRTATDLQAHHLHACTETPTIAASGPRVPRTNREGKP